MNLDPVNLRLLISSQVSDRVGYRVRDSRLFRLALTLVVRHLDFRDLQNLRPGQVLRGARDRRGGALPGDRLRLGIGDGDPLDGERFVLALTL